MLKNKHWCALDCTITSSTDNPSYFLVGFVVSQSRSGEIRPGNWRNLV